VGLYEKQNTIGPDELTDTNILLQCQRHHHAELHCGTMYHIRQLRYECGKERDWLQYGEREIFEGRSAAQAGVAPARQFKKFMAQIGQEIVPNEWDENGCAYGTR